jgi:hypothetical protein
MTRGGALVLATSLAAMTAVHARQAPAAGPWSMKHLPDTGQTVKYTKTPGEDADVTINPPSFSDPGDGTIVDNVTGLMWQKDDGGEMTWERAAEYARQLAVAGHHDWRLPTSHELFSILDEGRNPALNPAYFTRTAAEYWWSSETPPNDPNRVWVTNSGGGIGPHPRTETLSAGGTKRFHARCVRDTSPRPAPPADRFAANGDGTVTDRATGLAWQQAGSPADLTWEDALRYANALSLGGRTDWRLPNIKELQSLNDESRVNPSIDARVFPDARPVRYWSSTTLFSREASRAWFLDARAGITSYDDKTITHAVRCVRGR